jgi:hypothetical protein
LGAAAAAAASGALSTSLGRFGDGGSSSGEPPSTNRGRGCAIPARVQRHISACLSNQ